MIDIYYASFNLGMIIGVLITIALLWIFVELAIARKKRNETLKEEIKSEILKSGILKPMKRQ